MPRHDEATPSLPGAALCSPAAEPYCSKPEHLPALPGQRFTMPIQNTTTRYIAKACHYCSMPARRGTRHYQSTAALSVTLPLLDHAKRYATTPLLSGALCHTTPRDALPRHCFSALSRRLAFPGIAVTSHSGSSPLLRQSLLSSACTKQGSALPMPQLSIQTAHSHRNATDQGP
jgi:hypothetical protein